jgi:hypothetical protein
LSRLLGIWKRAAGSVAVRRPETARLMPMSEIRATVYARSGLGEIEVMVSHAGAVSPVSPIQNRHSLPRSRKEVSSKTGAEQT